MTGVTLSWSVLVWALAVASAACVMCLVAIVALRWSRRRRTRREERARSRVRPVVLGVLAAEDDELSEAVERLRQLPSARWPAAERYVLQTLSEVRGASRDALVRVLVDRGTMTAAMRESRGRSAIRRARAAEVLGLLARPDARRRLIHLTADPSRDVRTVAVRALGSLEDPALTATILATLDAERSVPASVVGTALLRARDADTGALRDALASASVPVRATAAAVAGHLLVTDLAVPVSVLHEHDPSAVVRSAAAQSMARFGSDDTTDSEVYG